MNHLDSLKSLFFDERTRVASLSATLSIDSSDLKEFDSQQQSREEHRSFKESVVIMYLPVKSFGGQSCDASRRTVLLF